MSRVVKGALRIIADFREFVTNLGAGAVPSRLAHPVNYTDDVAYELVYSDTLSLTTTPTDLGLDALTSKLNGAAVAFTEVNGIVVRHVSGTGTASIGGATNPLAIGGTIPIKPGGAAALQFGTDGLAVTNNSTDTLRLVSSGTCTVEVLIYGNPA
jgi:hypothetical protein